MKEGAVILLSMAQVDGQVKPRPAIALREMPGYGDWLVCGVSTQLYQYVSGFDEMIQPHDADFKASGLVQPSIIRLGFLQAVPRRSIIGRIGSIASDRHLRLLANLIQYLTP